MAGRKKASSSSASLQHTPSESDESDPMGVGRPNGRVYSPDYMAPPRYQPNAHSGHQSHYQQPFTTPSNPHMVEPPHKRDDQQDLSEPPYYVQDIVNKPRTMNENKQLPDDYRGIVLGGDPPPYKPPPNPHQIREKYREEYEATQATMPLPGDYREHYFPQSLGGTNNQARRFSSLRFGSQWAVCSWRLCAIVFLVISLCLAATTVYLAATQVTEWGESSLCIDNSEEVPNEKSPQQLPPLPSSRDSGNVIKGSIPSMKFLHKDTSVSKHQLESTWHENARNPTPRMHPTLSFILSRKIYDTQFKRQKRDISKTPPTNAHTMNSTESNPNLKEEPEQTTTEIPTVISQETSLTKPKIVIEHTDAVFSPLKGFQNPNNLSLIEEEEITSTYRSSSVDSKKDLRANDFLSEKQYVLSNLHQTNDEIISSNTTLSSIVSLLTINSSNEPESSTTESSTIPSKIDNDSIKFNDRQSIHDQVLLENFPEESKALASTESYIVNLFAEGPADTYRIEDELPKTSQLIKEIQQIEDSDLISDQSTSINLRNISPDIASEELNFNTSVNDKMWPRRRTGSNVNKTNYFPGNSSEFNEDVYLMTTTEVEEDGNMEMTVSSTTTINQSLDATLQIPLTNKQHTHERTQSYLSKDQSPPTPIGDTKETKSLLMTKDSLKKTEEKSNEYSLHDSGIDTKSGSEEKDNSQIQKVFPEAISESTTENIETRLQSGTKKRTDKSDYLQFRNTNFPITYNVELTEPNPPNDYSSIHHQHEQTNRNDSLGFQPATTLLHTIPLSSDVPISANMSTSPTEQPIRLDHSQHDDLFASYIKKTSNAQSFQDPFQPTEIPVNTTTFHDVEMGEQIETINGNAVTKEQSLSTITPPKFDGLYHEVALQADSIYEKGSKSDQLKSTMQLLNTKPIMQEKVSDFKTQQITSSKNTDMMRDNLFTEENVQTTQLYTEMFTESLLEHETINKNENVDTTQFPANEEFDFNISIESQTPQEEVNHPNKEELHLIELTTKVNQDYTTVKFETQSNETNALESNTSMNFPEEEMRHKTKLSNGFSGKYDSISPVPEPFVSHPNIYFDLPPKPNGFSYPNSKGNNNLRELIRNEINSSELPMSQEVLSPLAPPNQIPNKQITEVDQSENSSIAGTQWPKQTDQECSCTCRPLVQIKSLNTTNNSTKQNIANNQSESNEESKEKLPLYNENIKNGSTNISEKKVLTHATSATINIKQDGNSLAKSSYMLSGSKKLNKKNKKRVSTSSSSRRKNRRHEKKQCPHGKRLCSAEKIATAYLSLFGKHPPHFYVVSVLYGKEINSSSWFWKELSNATYNQGNSVLHRPHQVAPPDGASFSALTLGEPATFVLAPYGYWNLHLTLNEPTEVHLAFTIPRGKNLGLYARRDALPTHTQHDFMKVLIGSTSRELREARSLTGGVVEVSEEKVLESGEWFISLYNDDGDPHRIGLVVTRGSGSGECPNRCNGRGTCFLGRCQCQAGHSGLDCSEVLCPVLCNNRGEYVSGQCNCHPGWKGKECELRHHECEVPDCSGHGHCKDAKCHCAKGFTGEFCEKIDCPNPNCSDHGWCVEGTCVCAQGWKGADCSLMDTDALQCLPDCNKHGVFDINTHSCMCDPPWTGTDCSSESCSLDCGPHGKCENDACLCSDGWTGRRCSERLCDSRCAEHGQCKNGTCVCMTGWNGRHCTLPGCPGNCRGNGACRLDGENQWSCQCHSEWEGEDCSVRLEIDCTDGKDNDNDGLMDCEDPECCSAAICSNSQLCFSRPTPIDILLRTQPPAATASFYEKMRFIIQDNSLQSFPGSFNTSRAAVIRGRVVTEAGRPIVGLRVSSNHTNDGFTMTRGTGMFDFMVNGGGAVTLLFGKAPFKPRDVRVMIPWNELVVLDDIVMTVESKDQPYRIQQQEMNTFGMADPLFVSHTRSPCPKHDYDTLRPVVMSTWQNEFQGECPHVDAILVETQAVQESVQIPGTGLYLVYHSSRALGYKSTLRFQLTPETIPTTLRRVHLRIVLEGLLYKKTFEADPLIKFTFSWDRMNIYKQRVYGTTVARISVGYEHSGCEDMIIWEHRTTKVAGCDLAISDLGEFNIHVHHAYNFHQGILHKGDGRNIHLAGQRHLVTTLLGTKEQRDVVCGSRCEGPGHLSPLLAPTCLAGGPDGSLYVGDFNLIRRVTPDGVVYTVARLNETRVSYRYHVAVSPVTGKVYVSDPDAHQILEIIDTVNVRDPLRNVRPIAGSGQRCLPGDRNKCGDGGPAIHARLTYPKGLAISSNDDLYVADGTNIRVISGHNIFTVIGGHDHRMHWAPVPCNGTIERDQLRLRWPTELAISPLDGSLHVLDDHLVLRLTPDNRVQVVTGRPLHCPAPSHDTQHMARAALLLSPQSIAFSLQGDLFVAESDTQRINRVRVIRTSGHIEAFAGADSKCNCRDPACFCHTFDNVSATSAVFSSISAIAITPDNILHIADQAGYRVRSVRSLLPNGNKHNEYDIHSPDTHETYVFNRFGKHIRTKNLVTGQTIYRFTYNTNANTGMLSTVTDAASNSFKVIRRNQGDKTFIENPQWQRVTIHFSMMKCLEGLEAPDGYNISFRYYENSGLIQSKIEGGGTTYNYEYDDQGRLMRAVLPTGEIIGLNFDLSVRGAKVTATRDKEHSVTALIRGNSITHEADSVQVISEPQGEGRLRLTTSWDNEISLQRTAYRVLESKSPTAAEMFPVLSKQQMRVGGELVNRYEWSFSPAENVKNQQGMRASTLTENFLQSSAMLQVNGAGLLSLHYDPTTATESLSYVNGDILVNTTYDAIGRPTRWLPMSPFVPTTVNYDDWGHVTHWKRGILSEQYEYDALLRMSSVTYADNTTVRYEFKNELTKPEKVTYPSGKTYGLVYDEAGALRQVVTPSKSAYSLHIETSFGVYRLRLALPNDLLSVQMRIDEQGRLEAVMYPDKEILLYEYDLLGRLRNEIYGHGYTRYNYQENGLLKSARTRHLSHDIRHEYRYQTGLVKELRIRYGSKNKLHNVKVHYQYDGSARLRKMECNIESKDTDELFIRFDNQTGSLLAISDMRVIRNNVLETIIQNQKKYFVSKRIFDNYGRLASHVISLQDRRVFTMVMKYNDRGRMYEQVMEISGSKIYTRYAYTTDGQLLESHRSHSRIYTYDENGNVMTYTDGSRAEFLHHDDCDRVIKAGDGNVAYDQKGFVSQFDNQIFEYNSKGQLIYGYSGDKSWSFTFGYDHKNRVSVYKDHYGNVTQLIYARPDRPNLVTYLHNPQTHTTSTLIYDDRDHLMAVDKPEGRYFIATDPNGCPIAFFDENGSLVRRQEWTPTGRLADSVGPNMYVGIGPWGGIYEPITGIVVLEGHPYHPKLLQWMTPRWDRLTRATRQVTDVYIYRFRNNDPINNLHHVDYHFNDASYWLQLMGIKLNNVMSSEYQASLVEKPKPTIDVSAIAESEVISGLWCQYKANVDHLKDLSFFSRSHIQRHVGEWKGAPISRQSYVFGPGVLISNVNGRVLVTLIHVGNDVAYIFGDVLQNVLNNSRILDVTSNIKGKDTFYFMKEERRRFAQDQRDLLRISGIYNISQDSNSDPPFSSVGTPTVNIIIFYSRQVDGLRNKILKELESRAQTLAWEREAALIQSGRSGSHPWSHSEMDELKSRGRVSGYLARHVHSSSTYPLLASDPSNVLFKHESSRKRRKSRRTDKGWRRRGSIFGSERKEDS